MTQQEAIEAIDRLRDIRRAEFVATCRDCGLPEADILILLSKEPVMAPIEIKKFATPIELDQIRAIESDIRDMDPDLIKRNL